MSTVSSPVSSATASSMRGILAMCGAMALFAANDTLVKLVAADMPASQVMVLRGVVATSLVLCLTWQQVGLQALREIGKPSVLARAALEGFTAFTFITAIATAGLAEITAILQLTPILLAVAASVVLRERVSGRKWFAILAAFGGVMLIVRPDAAGLNLSTLLAVMCAVAVAVRDLWTREIDARISSLAVTAASTASVPLLGIAIAPFEAWIEPSGHQLALLSAAAVVVGIGNVLVVEAFRSGGEISVISPFRYSVVPWALIAAAIVFGAMPDGLSLIGTAIIVASGLYLWRLDLHLDPRGPA